MFKFFYQRIIKLNYKQIITHILQFFTDLAKLIDSNIRSAKKYIVE
jgi:hypothetical protein